MRSARLSAAPDRNLALELVRVTEAAALAASGWVGRGEKERADQAAVDAMRLMLDTVEMNGVVVIGEGEKDEAPMLYNGEHVGNGDGPEVDVAVDPLEGTRLTALGQPNAIAVIAVAERGTMFDPGRRASTWTRSPSGPEAADAIDIDAIADRERARASRRRRASTSTEVTVVVLERDRHDGLIAELREAGARVNLIRDGDVAPSIAAAQAFTGVDMLMGIGGTPEGVISAAAIKCLRRRDAGQALAAQRRGAAGARRRGVRRRPGPHHRRPGRPARTSSSPRPASRAARSSAASASAAPARRPSRS